MRQCLMRKENARGHHEYKISRILYKYVIYEGLNSGLLLKEENENTD